MGQAVQIPMVEDVFPEAFNGLSNRSGRIVEGIFENARLPCVKGFLSLVTDAVVVDLIKTFLEVIRSVQLRQ